MSLTIHTACLSATQPASICSYTPFLSLPTFPHYSKSTHSYSLRPNRRRSLHIYPPLTMHPTSFSCPTIEASISLYTHPTQGAYHLILHNPTGVDLLTYTPPLKIHTDSFSCPNWRPSPHVRIPLTGHTTLFSATQPALIC